MIKNKIFRIAFEYLIIVAISVIMAFNYHIFIVKNHYAPAGLNGIATMVQYKTGFSIGYFSLILNIPLCIVTFFALDKKFALRTLCYSVCYSVAYLIIGRLDIESLCYNAHGQNVIFPVLLSGIISGFSYGVLFMFRASTGGTDIISKFVSANNPQTNFFWVTFILNLLVAIASFFVYSKVGADGIRLYDYLPVCLCIVYCYVSSFVGDYFLKGSKKAVEFTIITAHPEEISKRIHTELRHSCTKINAVGGYTNDEKVILICVINKHQIAELNSILASFDNTFAFSEIVSETYGNFKKIR